MKREEALKRLAELKPLLSKRYGVNRLGIFGSTARDEATSSSDLDVVVEMPPLGLWESVGFQQELEETLGVSVDLVRYRETLNPRLKRRIDAEALYV